MKRIALLVCIICISCLSVRNPFEFDQQQSSPHILGRGVIFNKKMKCEAYMANDGSIKMRWIKQNQVQKKS